MKWQKLGLIFNANGQRDWMQTHAANPFALRLKDNRYRIYFSTRDKFNRSFIASLELDLDDPKQIKNLSENPILAPGERGGFDCDGISMGCIVVFEGQFFLYYTGWKLTKDVPWRNTIGLAVSTDGIHFEKYAQNPILGLNEIDPHSMSYPWVLREKDHWKMWYGSNLIWGKSPTEMEHVIKCAQSTDGLNWHRTGQICITLNDPSEIGVSRPCVLKDNGIYKMWYSRRKEFYRLGFASSQDGIHWRCQDDLVGLDVGPQSWDLESIEYAHVFYHENKLYALYCGNGYGKTGFGLAVQLKE